MLPLGTALTALAGLAELAGVATRRTTHAARYAQAQALARRLGRWLVVVGDPRVVGATQAHACGDLCVGRDGCPTCPRAIAADVAAGPVTEVPDDSAVVFASCALEYVPDVAAAWAEVMRMAGDRSRIVLVTVQPWTLTAALHPGARWTLTEAQDGSVHAQPVGTGRKLLTLASTVAGVQSIWR